MYKLISGDAAQMLRTLPDHSAQVAITSPPYYRLKDYAVDGQLGWEKSVKDYVAAMSAVLKELYRVIRFDGTCFLVVGDSYAGNSLQLVPHRLAIAAAEIGWFIRNDLIWAKTDAPPDSTRNRWRFTHEHVLFMSREPRGYKFNLDAIRVPYSERTLKRWGNGQAYGGTKAQAEAGPKGQRFKRGKTFTLNSKGTAPIDVLRLPTARSPLMHFATYPVEMIEQFVIASTDADDLVLDPFAGTATTGLAALQHGRRFIGIDLNRKYLNYAESRLSNFQGNPL